MSRSKKAIPIIDLFAGPGGLGEGFSSYDEGRFRIALSIEKDPVAHRTLRLRSFYRQFGRGEVPDEYYSVLRGELNDDVMFRLPKLRRWAEQAEEEAWCATLGRRRRSTIDKRIREALDGADSWVLIGGPPCQAYSLAGRSRNKGKEGYEPKKDRRHYLYREYLHVIAEHSPAVFVMENVKGMLSSSVDGKSIFQKILSDLQAPHRAVRGGTKKKNRHTYKIYSLVRPANSRPERPSRDTLDPHGYIVRCEQYGIPQARHRVILLGVRNDLDDGNPAVLVSLPDSLKPTVADVLGGMPKLRSGLSVDDSPDGWIETLKENLQKRWLVSGTAKLAGDSVKSCITRTLSHLKYPGMGRGAELLLCKSNFSHVKKSRLRKVLREWYLDGKIGGLLNSSTRGHIREDLSRYLYAACFAKTHDRSPKLSDFPADLKPSHENVDSGDFADRFRVQLKKRQSTTITSHISKDGHYYIHYDPNQCRSLTVREAARLQTFPDNYMFCGNRTQQYVQVGNAVPPLLAKQIAEIVSGVLKREVTRR